MPNSLKCSQVDCAFNNEKDCNASAIDVCYCQDGQQETCCDTFTTCADAGCHAQGKRSNDQFRYETGAPFDMTGDGPQIKCSVNDCVYNEDLACTVGGELHIKCMKKDCAPLCGDYRK